MARVYKVGLLGMRSHLIGDARSEVILRSQCLYLDGIKVDGSYQHVLVEGKIGKISCSGDLVQTGSSAKLSS